ncbi:MAG: TIGR04141 family sporadically distributed protein [Proteobacteria bacterium]|nr:TIGR04141 family sporadically distributed protein [Pseudomonadota bacterium]
MATFTIYLLRDSVKEPGDGLVDGAGSHEIRDGKSFYGTLFVKPTQPRPPKWAAMFDDYVERRLLGTVQSSSAVFVVPVDGRLFALTFGQGRFLLNPDAYEERFGLIVTLNSIKSDALRSMDKRTLVDDQNSRVQTSQAASALSFGVDIERDLVRGIVGRPTDAAFGKRLAGADALTVTADVEIPSLRKLLRRYLKQFASKEYQKNFPWVDQVRQLIPKGLAATRLDALLVEKMKEAWQKGGAGVAGLWLSVPDIVNWEVVDGFKFTRLPREGVFSDLHLPGLVQAYRSEEPTLEFLRKHYAMSVDEDERVIDRWPIYRCIHCEIEDDGKSFILSAGRWFEVDGNFVDSVESAFRAITRYPTAFPIYNHHDEGEYNKSVAENSDGRLCLMDRQMLAVGGIYDKVEFCDLFGDNQLIHVKHYGSSSVLGHLFNQGLVSGDLLKSHQPFVELANAKLPETHKLSADPDGVKFVARDVSAFTVVFLIISESDEDDVHLPFFAKVILKSVNTRLRELGYANVMLGKISCDPDVRVKQRVREKKRRVRGLKAVRRR